MEEINKFSFCKTNAWTLSYARSDIVSVAFPFYHNNDSLEGWFCYNIKRRAEKCVQPGLPCQSLIWETFHLKLLQSISIRPRHNCNHLFRCKHNIQLEPRAKLFFSSAYSNWLVIKYFFRANNVELKHFFKHIFPLPNVFLSPICSPPPQFVRCQMSSRLPENTDQELSNKSFRAGWVSDLLFKSKIKYWNIYYDISTDFFFILCDSSTDEKNKSWTKV